MQKYDEVGARDRGPWYKADEVDAEIESLKAQLGFTQDAVIATGEQKQRWEIAAGDALTERDTLRDVLTLLAPDLKTMAILYQQQGDHTRAQALMNICKSVGVE